MRLSKTNCPANQISPQIISISLTPLWKDQYLDGFLKIQFSFFDSGAVAGAGTDYYSMQYPSCYSPATQGYTGASGYPSMMGGAAASTPTAQPPHTHSEYAPASSSSTSLSGPTSSRRSPGPGVGGGGGPTGGGVTPAPLTTANVRKVVLKWNQALFKEFL